MSSITFPEVFQKGKVLCHGLGGGCDAITAYIVSQSMEGLSKQTAWSNAKRLPAVIPDDLKPLFPQSQYLFSIIKQVPLVKGENYYGTSGIDASLPPGPSGAPIIVHIPRMEKKEIPVPEDILKKIAVEIVAAGFEAIVGVDAGGDSLTGGIDHCGDPSTGTDQMMTRVCQYTNLPFIHVVCGPGCDGESTLEQMTEAIEKDAKNLMGILPMLSWAPLYRKHAGVLEDHRTPNIMAKAAEDIAAAAEKQKDAKKELMVVPRGIKPSFPLEMLASAYIFMKTPPTPSS